MSRSAPPANAGSGQIASASGALQPPTNPASRRRGTLFGLREQRAAPSPWPRASCAAGATLAPPVSRLNNRPNRASNSSSETGTKPRRGQFDRQRQPVEPAEISAGGPACARCGELSPVAVLAPAARRAAPPQTAGNRRESIAVHLRAHLPRRGLPTFMPTGHGRGGQRERAARAR